jgi:hypothetical protein
MKVTVIKSIKNLFSFNFFLIIIMHSTSKGRITKKGNKRREGIYHNKDINNVINNIIGAVKIILIFRIV